MKLFLTLLGLGIAAHLMMWLVMNIEEILQTLRKPAWLNKGSSNGKRAKRG